MSKLPLAHLYADATDCDKKVAAIYNIRSTYVHEGRIASTKKINYTFGELHSIALQSLEHILKTMLINSEITKSNKN